MTEHRTPARVIRSHPDKVVDVAPPPPDSIDLAEIQRLMTATEVGRVLQVSRKRVYEVVGHLAIQIAPRTLRWRHGDVLALIEERRRGK